MAAPLDPKSYRNMQSGLICEGAVSQFLMPEDCVTEAVNVHFDRIGAAMLRKGLTRLGSAAAEAGQNILGLYEFRDAANVNNQILAVANQTVYYLSGGVWTSKRTGLTAGQKSRFTTYLNYIFHVNGVDATAVWDGNPANSFLTTGNAASAPIGSLIENFRSRVWIAGNPTYPSRLYFSSIPSSITTPVVTWDTNVNTGQWIDISPSDGENLTALKRTKNTLLVFKNNHLYRVYSVNETEPDPKINVGTYSHESVVEAKDGVYFHHPSGFYRYADGDVKEISRPIIDFINAITLTNYSKVAGWADFDHVYWSVGDCTINGTTFSKVVCRYTISTKTWTIYSYPSQFLAASKYNNGSSLYNVVGDTAGNVYLYDTGKDDNGTPIFFSLVHRFYDIDGSVATKKIIEKMLFSHQGGTEAKVQYQIYGDKVNDWSKVIGDGKLKQYDTLFSSLSLQGRRFRPRVSGVSSGEPFVYEGFEVLKATSDLVTF